MTSRFRPEYRELTAREHDLIQSIKEKAEELEHAIEQARSGRYRALALTAIDEAVMWAVKEITT